MLDSFVLSTEVMRFIDDNVDVAWESDPLTMLVKEKQLRAYLHDGFWQSMDTVRDRELFCSEYWKTGAAKWKIW